jgi:hypothetical protein
LRFLPFCIAHQKGRIITHKRSSVLLLCSEYSMTLTSKHTHN